LHGSSTQSETYSTVWSKIRFKNIFIEFIFLMDCPPNAFALVVALFPDMRNKRNEALQAMDFPDIDQALTLFNYYGERHIPDRHLTLQDYFFTPRRATASSASFLSPHHHSEREPVGEICTRCGHPITRHAEFFVDTAKRRFEADLLCRPCLVFSARQVFGSTGSNSSTTSDVDAALAQEVQRLREMKWAPRINVELADMLLETRTFFS
jgi:hypothetical protein